MRIIISCLLALLLSTHIFGQEVSSSAPPIKTFSSEPNFTGSISNSVNLFTGDVALPINLVTIPSLSGLNAGISIFYNSAGIENNVRTRNLEAPTSTVGLGWNLAFPKIVVDHKQTGTILDDKYYLVDGTTTNELVRTSSATDGLGTYFTYKVKNNPFWKIKFYSELSNSGRERWEVTLDDGTKYVYGDKNSNRNTIQYMVRWDNWIGNSSNLSGQSRLAIAWNLSEIENIWGQKITYEYFNQENRIGGSSGQLQTEASYLKTITDSEGRKIKLMYSPKTSDLFMEPHTEKVEPDAYQEFYEKYFLDYIEVVNSDGNVLSNIDLIYTNFNNGLNKTKMLLSAISERTGTGHSSSPISFQYYAAGSPYTAGFLQKITYPLGGTSEYQYTSQLINHSEKRIGIEAPAGYAEARTWIGENYVVVAWRQLLNGTHSTSLREVKLYVYEWVGEWKSTYLGSIDKVKLQGSNPAYYDYKNFNVIVNNNFIAVLHGQDAVSSVETARHKLLLFKRNTAQLNTFLEPWKRTDFVKIYGTDVDNDELAFTNFIGGDDFVAIGNHRSHTFRFVCNGNGWIEDNVPYSSGTYFFTGGNNYYISHERDGGQLKFYYLSPDKKWQSRDLYSSLSFTSSGISYWYTAGSVAVVMAGGNSEFAYRWSRDYNTFYKDTKDINNNNLFGSLTDHNPVYIINSSLVGAGGRIARFNGSKWHTSTVTSNISFSGNPYFGYGEDFVVRPTSSTHGKRLEFNPNTMTWNFDTEMSGNHRSVAVGSSHYYFGKNIYIRNPNGNWQPNSVNFDANFHVSFAANPSLYVVTGLFPYEIKENVLVANGEIQTLGTNGFNLLYSDITYRNPGASNSIIVTYTTLGDGNIDDDPESTNKIYLTKFIEANNYAAAKQSDLAVTSISTNDGSKNQHLTFRYDLINAKMDPNGATANYNQVDVLPGTISSSSSPYGYTRYFYYNGLQDKDPRLNGLVYRSEIYNSIDALPIASSTTTYGITELSIYRPDSPYEVVIDNGYYIRETESTSTSDGITRVKKILYDNTNGLPSTVRTYTSSSAGDQDLVEKTIKYGHQFYTQLSNFNILNQPVQEQTLNQQSGEKICKAIKYKNWGSRSVPFPWRQYTWTRTGSSNFVFWDEASTPSTSWLLVSTLEVMDEVRGLTKQTSDLKGVSSSVIWDPIALRALAKVSNATSSQILYEGFENHTSNISTEAKAGQKSYTNSFTVVLPSAGSYLLSYWRKVGAGSWELMEQMVSSNSTIGGSGILLDEIRLHPASAYMTTYSYDKYGNVITECNANNEMVYYEYDDFQRLKLIRDKDGNIIQSKFYKMGN
ncbi:MAG: hypothetical protein EBR30_13120 [Cytophagia bacterium]|nr:hypothetical protein [Cytophagia bacterium]